MADRDVENRLLAKAETEAEIIVSLVRVSVAVVVVSSLVAALAFVDVAPPDTIMQQIHVALIVLGCYFALGLGALIITLRGGLRHWMPWSFASVDVLLILVNAWWSLVNPSLPQAYLFAAPIMWGAPVVFAFASLRYRPGLQAYMVVVVLLGSIALIWAAPLPAGSIEILPRLFDGPPNVVRTAMLGLCGGILVLAAHRRRALLEQAIREAEERSLLARFLPSQIAPMLTDDRRDDLRRGWRAEVAIVVVDIRGFTHLSESLSPEALSEFVSAFRRRIMEAADAHAGVIDKFIGDGALIVFGIPEPISGDAANAIAFGQALLHRIETWRPNEAPNLKIGIGAHFGEVFAGAVGDLSRLEFTVLGDAVNVAARLEEISKDTDQGFIVSEALLNAAAVPVGPGNNDWIRLEMLELRGREAAIVAFGWSDGTAAPVDRFAGRGTFAIEPRSSVELSD